MRRIIEAERPMDSIYKYEIGEKIEFDLTGRRTVRAVAVQQDGTDMIFAMESSVAEEQWNQEWTTEGGYKESWIRKQLNGRILDTFPEDLRKRMTPFTAEENEGDLLTLPSKEEIFDKEKMFEGMKDRRNVIIMDINDRYTDWYWLRSVYSASSACLVDGNGAADYFGASVSIGVRPLFKIFNQ